MRALVFHGPGDIRVETCDDPAPGADEVVVAVHATGICGSDVHGVTGESGRRHPGQVMGHETVGHVVAPGSEAAGLSPGQVVTVNPVVACGDCRACHSGAEQSCARRRVIGVTPDLVSAFAERMAVPARNVVPLPDGVPLEYGALVEPLAVGYHAAVRGGCASDDTVLVVGGGPIGQACALAARRLGARRVAVTEPDAGRRALVEALGVDVVDPTAPDAGDALHTALDGAATLVLDAVGSTTSLEDAFRWSGFGARVVLVGMNAPRVDLSAYAVSTEERSLVGSFCYSARDFLETAAWVGTAPPELAHLVDGRVGLDDAPAAFTDLGTGASDASKVLVFPAGVPAPEEA